MAERIIFHIDVNNAFLSWTAVYLLKHGYKQDIRKIPAIIGGDEETRHGIVLAKSESAKKCGIRTGETLWEAKLKCPDLILLPPHGDQYIRFCKLMRKLYAEYTNQIEPFGLDENWLDVTDHPLGGA